MATAPRTPSGAKVVAKKFYTFKWEGVNRKGQKVSGEMQGENPNQLKTELRKQGVTVSKVRRKTESLFSKYSGAIKPMDIAMISRQITTMLTAGVPLVQTLQPRKEQDARAVKPDQPGCGERYAPLPIIAQTPPLL